MNVGYTATRLKAQIQTAACCKDAILIHHGTRQQNVYKI